MRLWAALAALPVLALAVVSCSAGDEEWVPVRETNLEVAAGSPLDFSTFLPNPPIDASSRIAVNGDGRLVHAGAPDRPARLMCASLAWSPASGGFPDHEQADRYALQLKRHGYNIARFHFVDAALMFGRAKDFDFDPETADRVHYLMAALKRNGVSWILDGLSSWRGAYGGYDDRWEPKTDLKLAVMIEDAAFDHWRKLQEKTLKTVNPYTGIAPVDDPALVMIVPVNEGGIEFDSILREKKGEPHYSPKLAPLFGAWLKKRYGSESALGRAPTWAPTMTGLPESRYEKSPRMRDLQAFFVEVETRASEKMTGVLRGLGYRGLIANFNNWPSIQTALTRENQQAVALNTYEDWVGGYEPGSAIGQVSSIEDDASYSRVLAGARWLGKPFVVTEYDHLFWSRYRAEAGVVFPAYAALQGWDAICRHGHGPIALRYGEDYLHKRQMLPYAIALDPVARAGETLSALLFRRGDVAEARNVVPFAVRGEADLGENMQSREPDNLTRIGLVSRIGLKPADQIRGDEIAVRQPRDDKAGLAILSAMRGAGMLPPRDGTDPSAGTYVSDTGEIRLDDASGRIAVDTPMTDAIAYTNLSERVTVGALTVGKADGVGMFSVSSLDGKPVAESRRLLAIFATDARNTGMKFQDFRERVIDNFGKLPVLIRKSALDFSLAGTGAWRISPVGLDGVVKPAVARGEGVLSTRLSNDGPDGPTTYFLIERS